MASIRELLAKIWKLEFEEKVSNQAELMEKLHIDIGTLRDLQREGYLDGYKLTDQGRRQIRVVACGGVFDILHPGHGFFLQKSKEYGDVLVVIVARDETVERRKRIPIVPEEQRLEMVRLLKPVDIAVLGGRGDFLKIIEKIRPDVIVLGPDQTHDEDYIRSELERRGLKVEVKRIEEYKECALHSTRSILQKIIETEFPDQRKSP